jgi:hypothetical protein
MNHVRDMTDLNHFTHDTIIIACAAHVKLGTDKREKASRGYREAFETGRVVRAGYFGLLACEGIGDEHAEEYERLDECQA